MPAGRSGATPGCSPGPLVVLAVVTFAFLYLARLPEVSRQLPARAVRGPAGRNDRDPGRPAGRVRLRPAGVATTGATSSSSAPASAAASSRRSSRTTLSSASTSSASSATRPTSCRSAGRCLGPIEDLLAVIHERVVDEVAICLFTEDWGLIESIATTCESEGKLVRLPVPMPALSIATAHVEDLDGTPVLSLLSGPNAALALAARALIDVTAATAGMVLLAPLIGGIALAIALTDGRPIFYRQERVGLQGRRFSLVKFRSMVANADGMIDALQSPERDRRPRVQDVRRSAGHARRPLPAPVEPRRAAAALERPRRRDEPRRPAAAAAARGRRVRHLAPAPRCR